MTTEHLLCIGMEHGVCGAIKDTHIIAFLFFFFFFQDYSEGFLFFFSIYGLQKSEAGSFEAFQFFSVLDPGMGP